LCEYSVDFEHVEDETDHNVGCESKTIETAFSPSKEHQMHEKKSVCLDDRQCELTAKDTPADIIDSKEAAESSESNDLFLQRNNSLCEYSVDFEHAMDETDHSIGRESKTEETASSSLKEHQMHEKNSVCLDGKQCELTAKDAPADIIDSKEATAGSESNDLFLQRNGSLCEHSVDVEHIMDETDHNIGRESKTEETTSSSLKEHQIHEKKSVCLDDKQCEFIVSDLDIIDKNETKAYSDGNDLFLECNNSCEDEDGAGRKHREGRDCKYRDSDITKGTLLPEGGNPRADLKYNYNINEGKVIKVSTENATECVQNEDACDASIYSTNNDNTDKVLENDEHSIKSDGFKKEAEEKDHLGAKERKGNAIFMDNTIKCAPIEDASYMFNCPTKGVGGNCGGCMNHEKSEVNYEQSINSDIFQNSPEKKIQANQTVVTNERTGKIRNSGKKGIEQMEGSRRRGYCCYEKKAELTGSMEHYNFPPRECKITTQNKKIGAARLSQNMNSRGGRYAMLRGSLLGTRNLSFFDDGGHCNIFAKVQYLCPSKMKNALLRRRKLLHQTEVKEASTGCTQWDQSDFFVQLTDDEKDKTHPNIFGDILIALYCVHSRTKQNHFVGQCILQIPQLCKCHSTRNIDKWQPLFQRNASSIGGGAALHIKAEVILPRGMDAPTKKVPVQKEAKILKKRNNLGTKPTSETNICMEVAERHRRNFETRREQAQKKIALENKRLQERLSKMASRRRKTNGTSLSHSGQQHIMNGLRGESTCNSANLEHTKNEHYKNKSSMNGELFSAEDVDKRVENPLAPTLDAEQQRIQKTRDLILLVDNEIAALTKTQLDSEHDNLNQFESLSSDYHKVEEIQLFN